ncbi:MAG: phosphoenolpyruvate--protein phosphotransferase [Treponema sp.]
MEVFIGISASDGTGIGSAFFIPEQEKKAIPQKQIAAHEAENDWNRFEQAKQEAADEITQNLSRLCANDKADAVQKEIFETYLQMLSDPVFLKEVKSQFEATLFSIEYTIHHKANEYADKLRSAGNEYLAARAKDITDVFGRVLDKMLNRRQFDINAVPDGSVILARALNPTDAIILTKKNIAALVLSDEGITSHVAILARNYGIPTVVGIHYEDLKRAVKDGDAVIVDAKNAKVAASPDEKTLADYKAHAGKEKDENARLNAYRDKPALSKDGEAFTLYANIGTPEEAEIAREEGADGIGLFRTEFLFMSRTNGAPAGTRLSIGEEEQFEAYKKALSAMGDKPVTIRTLDAGGDKIVNSVDIPQFEEKNPLLGLRAIRLCLMHPALFKTQIRALYRASVFGNLRIMLPLVTTLEQVKQSHALIDEVKRELAAENIPFAPDVPVGIMVETAAAAVASDILAKTSGFFSVGTNDLTQYALGVDRENAYAAALYDEFNISVLRLIDMTVQNARKAGIPLSVCGEMAAKEEGMLTLAGLGVRAFSMSPKLIARAKETLSQFSTADMQAKASAKLNTF